MLGGDIYARRGLRDEIFSRGALRAIEMAAIRESRVSARKLDGCHKQVIAFAEDITGALFAAPQSARRLVRRIHSGTLAEAEREEGALERARAQTLADPREIIVTGVAERVREIERSFAFWMRAGDVEIF